MGAPNDVLLLVRTKISVYYLLVNTMIVCQHVVPGVHRRAVEHCRCVVKTRCADDG